MPNEATIDPRYMKYNKVEVEKLLDKVENPASEESVRGIVSNYAPDSVSSDSSSSD